MSVPAILLYEGEQVKVRAPQVEAPIVKMTISRFKVGRGAVSLRGRVRSAIGFMLNSPFGDPYTMPHSEDWLPAAVKGRLALRWGIHTNEWQLLICVVYLQYKCYILFDGMKSIIKIKGFFAKVG